VAQPSDIAPNAAYVCQGCVTRVSETTPQAIAIVPIVTTVRAPQAIEQGSDDKEEQARTEYVIHGDRRGELPGRPPIARLKHNQIYAWSVKAQAEPKRGDKERSRDDQPAPVKLCGRYRTENQGISHRQQN
jgi:hypothetical protein